mgnify:FL=1
MKITKRQLRRLIREEKRKILSEGKAGLAPGIGFANWDNSGPKDFAKAYHGEYARKTNSAARTASRRAPGANRESLRETVVEAYHTLEEALRYGDPISIERAANTVKNLLGSKIR